MQGVWFCFVLLSGEHAFGIFLCVRAECRACSSGRAVRSMQESVMSRSDRKNFADSFSESYDIGFDVLTTVAMKNADI
jgi:hypothetical protein